MRLPLLAVCLLLAVSLGSGPAPGEPAPLRDQVVPEGIAGLTAAEIARLAREALARGDLVRWRELAEAAAGAGDAGTALDLARQAYREAGLAAAPEIERYARLGLGTDPRALSDAYFWLALVGERVAGRRVATAPSRAQLVLWYRIVAWDLLRLHRSRVEMQVGLESLRHRLIGQEPFPPAFLAALGEIRSWFDERPAALFARSKPLCDRPDLLGSERLCLALLREAAERGYAPAMPAAAFRLLELPGDELDLWEKGQIQGWLCHAALTGRADALEELGRLLGAKGWPPRVDLSTVSVLLERADLAELAEPLKALFTDLDRRLYERRRVFSKPPFEC